MQHVVPTVGSLVESCAKRITVLEDKLRADPEMLDLNEMETLCLDLGRAWGAVHHLNMVQSSSELRDAIEQVQPQVVELMANLSQSEPISKAYQSMAATLPAAQGENEVTRIVDSALRDAKLSGIFASPEDRERIKKLQMELSRLSHTFRSNVVASRGAWSHTVTDPKDLAGVPDHLLKGLAVNPEQWQEGPWKLDLTQSCMELVKYCQARPTRELLYRASIVVASTGEWDNSQGLVDILQRRQDLAQLLGYGNYADVSLASKSADSTATVESFLTALGHKAQGAARVELEELRALAQELDQLDDLKPWDTGYYAEKLSESLPRVSTFSYLSDLCWSRASKTKFKINSAEVQQYFPADHVMAVFFDFLTTLFGVRIQDATAELEPETLWDPHVRYFQVADADSNKPIASFFLDLYARPGAKSPGAWMDNCVDRSAHLKTVPVAHMVLNLQPPSGGTPTLMSLRDVETLFHEFGHALQHMLTTVAGINNIEWDVVELPSQFMENWVYHKPLLRRLTRHHESGKPMPESMIDSIVAARTFMSGSFTARQVFFSLLDLSLHVSPPTSAEEAVQRQQSMSEAFLARPLLPEDRFLLQFLHIFGGGYAAGYWSYKWAEVLAADAFGRFEEDGALAETAEGERKLEAIGREFRATILAQGGSQNPLRTFEDFRGRPVDYAAFYRQLNLDATQGQ
ncbi:uncharacterized protein MONBRDRAFT_26805 [Monosiga brevicollis MX1]|uniref:oligopeptidase A n=1 Tax=Monosiga brevicollis TaxID=81824 RepID=A9V3F1_MONBE|nr:uncharacterized protein MONBRDRAFT_26805 [Monosiga brevicollis MX1]EDQ88050.1 predicted protein [Monosiga brevicollis MX1]|eukprot:XP_001747126.1 hypothetical protein [Monosiga brevicollis MX1]